jgi:3-dehydroquinate synthetase
MARACDLGRALNITPPERAADIMALLRSFGYETGAPHPLAKDGEAFSRALESDKKKQAGRMTYIIPDARGARAAVLEGDTPV